MTPKEAKAAIGKTIEWEYAHDRHRGSCLVAKGVIQEVKGQNVLMSGAEGWTRLPNLKNAVVLENGVQKSK